MNEITVLDGVGTTLFSVARALLPILGLFIVFQVFFLRLPASEVLNLLKGILLASLGLLLFFQGVNAGFLPYGRAIGDALGTITYDWLLMPLGFLLGFLAAWGEPGVRILSEQVEETSAGSIRRSMVLFAICLGVAFSVALGMARIAYGIPLLYILIPGYAIVIAMLFFSQNELLPIAFDAGGVATGPISNTFLLALALGMTSARGGYDLLTYGLGMVALISLAPIISVMVLGLILRVRMPPRG